MTESAQTNYTISRLFSMTGNYNESAIYLNMALKQGFEYTWVLDKDPYLENMRGLEVWDFIRSQLPPSEITFKERAFDTNTYWIEIGNR